MEKIKTLKYCNEILINTSLYKYLSIINETNLSEIIGDVVYDSFFETARSFLKNRDKESEEQYKAELRLPYQKYVEKTLKEGWPGIKRNLLTASYIAFEQFLCHLVEIYCAYFPILYSDEDIRISFSVIQEFPTENALRGYFIKTHIDAFIAMTFDEKIQYVKKTLKLNSDDIWILREKDLIYDIYLIRDQAVHSVDTTEIPDDDFYLYINYLCSVIFRLSAYSQKKYGIQFEWISDTNLRFMIADEFTAPHQQS